MTTLGEAAIPATSSENIEFGGGASAASLCSSRNILEASGIDMTAALLRPAHFWGVCRTRSRCEKALSEILSILKIPWYLPLTPRKDASRHVAYVPLFPGFLFFQLRRGTVDAKVAKANNPNLRLKPKVLEGHFGNEGYYKREVYEIDSRELIKPSARILKESPLTARAASYAAGFIPVTDQIQLLRELAALSSQKEQAREKTLVGKTAFKGDKVRILSGPFEGFIAVLESFYKENNYPFPRKAQITFKTLGQTITTWFSADQLALYKEPERE